MWLDFLHYLGLTNLSDSELLTYKLIRNITKGAELLKALEEEMLRAERPQWRQAERLRAELAELTKRLQVKRAEWLLFMRFERDRELPVEVAKRLLSKQAERLRAERAELAKLTERDERDERLRAVLAELAELAERDERAKRLPSERAERLRAVLAELAELAERDERAKRLRTERAERLRAVLAELAERDERLRTEGTD